MDAVVGRLSGRPVSMAILTALACVILAGGGVLMADEGARAQFHSTMASVCQGQWAPND